MFSNGEPFGTYVYHCALKGVQYIVLLAHRRVNSRAGLKYFGLFNMTSCILVYMYQCFPSNLPSFVE